MTPVPLCRETAVPFELSVYWKIVISAALASFIAVVLLAWYASRQPSTLAFEVTGECSAR